MFNKEKNPKRHLMICLFTAVTTLFLSAYLEHINYRFSIYTPHSWGFLKGYLDPIFIFLFVWGGWICAIPIGLALCFRLNLIIIICLWIFVTFSTATLHSLTSFKEISFTLLLKGNFVFSLIFVP